MRRAAAISVCDHDRHVLERWTRGRSTPALLVLRAKIILSAAEGYTHRQTAAKLGTDELRPRAGVSGSWN